MTDVTLQKIAPTILQLEAAKRMHIDATGLDRWELGRLIGKRKAELNILPWLENWFCPDCGVVHQVQHTLSIKLVMRYRDSRKRF